MKPVKRQIQLQVRQDAFYKCFDRAQLNIKVSGGWGIKCGAK